MRNIYPLLLLALLFHGCSSKQYYEPKNTEDNTIKIEDIGSSIIDINSVGATLKNNTIISKNGISKLTLDEGFKFINDNKGTILSADLNATLAITKNKNTQKITFEKNVISATIEDNLIAFSFSDNTINLYNLDTKSIVFKEYLKISSLNDIKITNPIFLNTVILYPTLDGKIVIVDKAKKSILKTINLDPRSDVNNIIFVHTINDSLIAATSKKLFSFVDGKVNIIDLDIKSVAVGNNNVYVATLDGQIIKYNENLQKLKSKKFKFAKFHTIGFGKYLYALESQGYLIQLDEQFKDIKIYDFSFDEEEKVITIDNKLYFEDSYIILD